jgi:hypothetical protein
MKAVAGAVAVAFLPAVTAPAALAAPDDPYLDPRLWQSVRGVWADMHGEIDGVLYQMKGVPAQGWADLRLVNRP